MEHVICETRSVCPVCLRNLPAQLLERPDGAVVLQRTCPAHGEHSAVVWRGKTDFSAWCAGSEPLAPGAGERCPGDCGLCASHESGSCCVVLGVTARCDLRCRFCFADGGRPSADPPREELEEAIRDIARRCGGPLLQLSGGEPTLRDDLPALVRAAKAAGCSYVQVNTNGLRLAREPGYARQLAEAGLDIVFLQFDGTRDGIYETLRGAPLLAQKLEAVRVCAVLGLGVTLVPTVVRGVNTDDLGALVRLAAATPGVRGVHFQPVSYLGRFPDAPEERYTLDELMDDLHRQTGIPMDAFLPSRCDHPLCGFHAAFLKGEGGALEPLSAGQRACGRGSAKENRDYVARRWMGGGAAEKSLPADADDFDRFLYRVRHESLTLSAMPFQDAGNLNIERLRRCSLHVYERGKLKPFCSHYLTAMKTE